MSSSISSSSTGSSSSRRVFIGGNWKCNGTRSTIESLVSKLNSVVNDIPKNVDVCVAPTNIHLDLVKSTLNKQYIVSAQNCSVGQGAYTGEVSADQLVDFGLKWTILGHSERRQLFGANDSTIAKQVASALQHGLSVIACIGETLDERKADKTLEVVERQLGAIAGIVDNRWDKIVVAYEPVWAIGTGVTASAAQAQEVHAAIRKYLTNNYGSSVASNTRIIYGGSVNAKNCDELIRETDIDGFLVGGASLKGDEFATIITAAKRASKL